MDKCVDKWSMIIWMNEFHIILYTHKSNVFSTHMMHNNEWMNELHTIFIIKLLDDKFVMVTFFLKPLWKANILKNIIFANAYVLVFLRKKNPYARGNK
jgi:hypothetical protein